jgi:NAD(P)-dependent dehydrogenase (short-subunit alcohol dehydrogenase family)
MSAGNVVVTGAAASGIGEAITRRLHSAGYTILGSYEDVDQSNAHSLLAQLQDRIRLVQVDHGDRESLSSFVAGVQAPVAGLVNAQFFFELEDPENFDHELWDRSLSINLSAPNYLVHELKTKLLDGSSIVIITSTEGFVGSFGASAYAASKAAVHNLVKSLANNLGSRHIRANALAAGWIGGVMDTDEVFNMSRRITPLGRLGDPDEIAAIVEFLLTKKSSFINGTVVTADGGYSGVDTIAKYEFEHSKS